MIIQYVKYRSGLSDDDARRMMEERAPQYRAMPGLLQKYYVQDPQSGEFGGIYIWDSEESLEAFRQSELARSIPAAYQTVGLAHVETLEVLFPLRTRTGGDQSLETAA